MPMQEFLASFAVDIDESGVTRLQTILKDNRALAESLSEAFASAKAALESAFSGLPESLTLPVYVPMYLFSPSITMLPVASLSLPTASRPSSHKSPCVLERSVGFVTPFTVL